MVTLKKVREANKDVEAFLLEQHDRFSVGGHSSKSEAHLADELLRDVREYTDDLEGTTLEERVREVACVPFCSGIICEPLSSPLSSLLSCVDGEEGERCKGITLGELLGSEDPYLPCAETHCVLNSLTARVILDRWFDVKDGAHLIQLPE